MSDAPDKLRIDKWLWHARFFKTRTLAAKEVGAGHCRVNGTPIAKPAYSVSIGDVLTFRKDRHVRVIKIVALGARRGPAPEAQGLFEDLDPPKPRNETEIPPIRRLEGNARPTKKDRRKLDLDRRGTLE